MKKRNMIGILLFILGSSPVTIAGTYTLDSLLKIGYKNSHELRSIDEELQKTDAQLYEYYGKALPSIDLNANLQHAFSQYNPYAMKTEGSGMSIYEMLLAQGIHEPGSLLLANVLDGMTSGFKQKDNTANVGLSLKQPLFAQGKVLIGLKIAKLYCGSLLCKYEEAKMTVKASVTKLFYLGLFASKTEEIKMNAVKLAEESHRLTVLKFVTGKAAELDTLNSRLFYENVIIEYEDAQKNRRNAFDGLIKTIGIDENVDTLKLSGDFPEDTYSIGMEEAIANVQSYNRKINQLRTSSQIQDLMIRMAKTDFYPLIYCGGSVGKITQFNTYGDIKWQDDQKVYLGLNYTLFNGLQRRFKIRQAKSEATMFNHAMQIAVNGIEIQTRSAWETMEMNRKRLGQTAGLVAFARKAYDITRKAYDIGTKTLLDLQQSEQSYNDALLKNSAARFALHSATVDLRVLLGNYLLEK